MNFKNGTKKDIPRVASFFKEIDDDFVPPLSKRYDINKEITRRFNLGNELLILERNKDILGVAIISENRKNKGDASIDTIGISKNARGAGLGKILLSECLNRLTNHKDHLVHIKTWSPNKKALALYKKEGFEVEKVIKNARGKGIDTVYMEECLRGINIDINI